MKVAALAITILTTVAFFPPPGHALETDRSGLQALGVSSERLARVREAMQDEVDAGHIGSVIGLIARAGEIIFLEAVGEASPGVPITEDAIARHASIGKAFTAAATMILYEEGVLTLDDPVSKYLPEYAELQVGIGEPGSPGYELVDPRRPVVVRDLLTHESGLSVASDAFEEAWMATEAKTTTADLAARVARIPMTAHPGEEWDYGYYGSNYEVLAAVLEAASGMTLEDLFNQKIFGPLAMRDTYFFVPQEKEGRLPAFYQMRDGELSVARPAGKESDRSTYFAGGGGTRSTIRDFYRFCQMLLNGGELEGIRLLSPKSVQLMMTDHTGPDLRPFDDDEWGWGFGAMVRRQVRDGDIGTAGTYSWNGGTGTAFWIDPQEELVGIIFAPYWPPAHREMRKKFEVAMYQSLVD